MTYREALRLIARFVKREHLRGCLVPIFAGLLVVASWWDWFWGWVWSWFQ